MQRLFNPLPCGSTGKRGGTVRDLTPQSKLDTQPDSFFLAFFSFQPLAAAHSVGLSWDASTSHNINRIQRLSRSHRQRPIHQKSMRLWMQPPPTPTPPSKVVKPISTQPPRSTTRMKKATIPTSAKP